MNVLALSSYANLGGAEICFGRFLEHRPEWADVESIVLADGPLVHDVSDLGVPVSSWPEFEGRPNLGGFIRMTRRLFRRLRTTRPDVIWALGQKSTSMALPAARLAGVPLVWHKVDFSWDRELAQPLSLASSGVITCSGTVARSIGALHGRPLTVVLPPVALDEKIESEPDPRRPLIGALGRLVPYKGHDRIVRAAGLVAREQPSLRVVIAGDPSPDYPDYPNELRRIGDEVGLGDRLELPGFVEDVGGLLSSMTVLVSATYRDSEGFGFEGLSGAWLEASWTGVPIVATRGGGASEGVADGVTGTLVEAPDPALLAHAIRPYVVDAELRRKTGEAGRRFARRLGLAPDLASRRLFQFLRMVWDQNR
jgi:glycosyltransferase involved in cell wall biosynthesis